MQEDKDFIKREIQRFTLFLSRLVGRVQELEEQNFEVDFKQLDLEFKREFDSDLSTLYQMPDEELLEKIRELHEDHIEKLSELLAMLANKIGEDLARKSLIHKSIVLLDHVDSISSTFSLQRMELKKKLRKYL